MSKRPRRRYINLWNQAVRLFAHANEGCYVADAEHKVMRLYRRLIRVAKKQSAERA